jgi:uncharacterized membrane protein YccC
MRDALAFLRWDRRAGAQSRLLLALKTAIAAGVALALAGVVPGTASHYPYYAPLGAVIAMGPTVLHGIREGFRTVFGLAAGIGLAFVVTLVGAPHYLTVPVAVGVAVVVAGFRIVGQANTWVASAAIFVLLIGGPHPATYSTGYLTQTLLGAAVGVAVNMLIFPPLAVREAARGLESLQRHLAEHLGDLGDALEDDEVNGHAWAERLDRLQTEAVAVRGGVRRADESRRGNPRAVLHGLRAEVDSDYTRLRALERAIFALTDATDILGHASPVTESFGAVDDDLVPAFADVLRRVAEAVAPDQDGEADGKDARTGRAEDALAALQTRLDKQGRAHPSEVPMSTAAAVAIRNVLVAVSQPPPQTGPISRPPG